MVNINKTIIDEKIIILLQEISLFLTRLSYDHPTYEIHAIQFYMDQLSYILSELGWMKENSKDLDWSHLNNYLSVYKERMQKQRKLNEKVTKKD